MIQLLQDTPDCTIQHDTVQNWLLVTWVGPQPMPTAQARCLDIVAHVQATGSTKLLNDGSDDDAGWLELAPWVARVFLPRLAAQGVVAIAWVSPRNLRALVCMNQVLTARTYPNVAAFTELEDAHVWLCKAAKSLT